MSFSADNTESFSSFFLNRPQVGLGVTNMLMIPSLLSPPSNFKDAIVVLNWCLESVMGWRSLNKLKRNSDKAVSLG